MHSGSSGVIFVSPAAAPLNSGTELTPEALAKGEVAEPLCFAAREATSSRPGAADCARGGLNEFNSGRIRSVTDANFRDELT